MAVDLPLSSLQVDVLHSRTHGTRILVSVFDHQYLRPHVWWGNLGRNGQAGRTIIN